MRRIATLCLPIACLSVISARAAGPRYDALGASDAVGVGATSPGADGQPNNGYVYRIDTWLKSRYAHWQLDNRGVEGLTAPEIRDVELGPAIAAQPAIVTLWAGTNDVRISLQKMEPTATLKARFEGAYTTILSRLRAETPAFIVTADIPDLSLLPSAVLLTPSLRQLAHDDSLAVNEVINRVAQLYAVPVVGVYSDPQSYDPANFWWDGFHPNDAGYLLLAAKFEAILRGSAWRIVSGLGDVNDDGAVDAADVPSLLSIIAGISKASERQAVAGDVSPAGGNGALSMEDAVTLARRASGLVPDSQWR